MRSRFRHHLAASESDSELAIAKVTVMAKVTAKVMAKVKVTAREKAWL